jgi:hypothetical protein
VRKDQAPARIGARSTLAEVAAVVGCALKTAGIDAVLTGGACATIYSKGEFQSLDLDFILAGGADRKVLDGAMAAAGFGRAGDHYVHPKTRFFVEFPRGPLSIGKDSAVEPVKLRLARRWVKALSATDSCRDRLAAYFFWNDLSSLKAAVAIARSNKVDLRSIARWSGAEGHAERFEEFRREVESGGAGARGHARG